VSAVKGKFRTWELVAPVSDAKGVAAVAAPVRAPVMLRAPMAVRVAAARHPPVTSGAVRDRLPRLARAGREVLELRICPGETVLLDISSPCLFVIA
jgi:hypothetical protein